MSVGSGSSGSSRASSASAQDMEYVLQGDVKQEYDDDDEEEEEDDEDEDRVDPRELKIDNVKGRKRERKRGLDVTYVPGSDEDGDFAPGEKVDTSELEGSAAKRAKKRREELDDTYVPGDEEDEDSAPDANNVDPGELIDAAARRHAKRKREVDATYSPGGDKDDDSQSDIATAPKARSHKKRKMTTNPAARGARQQTPEKTKESILPITPSIETDFVKGEPTSQQVGVTTAPVASYPTPDSLLSKTANKARDLSSPTRRRAPVKHKPDDDAEYVPERADSAKPQETWEKPRDSKPSHLKDNHNEEYQDRPIRHKETTGIVFDFSVERAKRWASAINVPEGLYNEEEKDLFYRLAMRGFEPVIPTIWRHDFPTLPESLYPRGAEPSSAPIIDVTRSSNLYATKALSSLFAVGGRVRDCEIHRKKPEPLIKQAITNYIRWALFDANLHTAKDAVPVHVIYAQKKGESTLKAVQKMNEKLRKLVRRHHEALGVTSNADSLESDEQNQKSTATKFPLLVGFIICGPIVAILTHSTDPEEIGDGELQGRFMGQFDLSERGQDVWNSLAIAITVMSVRRTMLSLAEEGNRGYDHERSPSVFDIDL
ncbi:uncharacterized protein BO80DRAFT_464990 [Aspergillus ibericus CBS 121593]|uniref:Uncharacterized protein n=1 Tax=Aspergillus ibericus CBS 121593 TaxID=1448316 RepID=A0A395H0Z1_9EURO|nr:hypothetical protein BO80DRAFT_464990 [Aspergillus ibericus CBS 121593]RAL00905.1 hypothetical protein BO80DRAFT_464990 [Aspergillus ibericus CBS 121593]